MIFKLIVKILFLVLVVLAIKEIWEKINQKKKEEK